MMITMPLISLRDTCTCGARQQLDIVKSEIIVSANGLVERRKEVERIEKNAEKEILRMQEKAGKLAAFGNDVKKAKKTLVEREEKLVSKKSELERNLNVLKRINLSTNREQPSEIINLAENEASSSSSANVSGDVDMMAQGSSSTSSSSSSSRRPISAVEIDTLIQQKRELNHLVLAEDGKDVEFEIEVQKRRKEEDDLKERIQLQKAEQKTEKKLQHRIEKLLIRLEKLSKDKQREHERRMEIEGLEREIDEETLEFNQGGNMNSPLVGGSTGTTTLDKNSNPVSSVTSILERKTEELESFDKVIETLTKEKQDMDGKINEITKLKGQLLSAKSDMEKTVREQKRRMLNAKFRHEHIDHMLEFLLSWETNLKNLRHGQTIRFGPKDYEGGVGGSSCASSLMGASPSYDDGSHDPASSHPAGSEDSRYEKKVVQSTDAGDLLSLQEYISLYTQKHDNNTSFDQQHDNNTVLNNTSLGNVNEKTDVINNKVLSRQKRWWMNNNPTVMKGSNSNTLSVGGFTGAMNATVSSENSGSAKVHDLRTFVVEEKKSHKSKMLEILQEEEVDWQIKCDKLQRELQR